MRFEMPKRTALDLEVLARVGTGLTPAEWSADGFCLWPGRAFPFCDIGSQPEIS
jgi:hypothetical protein